MKTKNTILTCVLFAALAMRADGAGVAYPFDNVIIKTNLDMQTNGNITNANIVTAAHFVGDGSGLTGVSGAGGGLTALAGKGTNNVLAAPTLTNSMFVASNAQTTAYADSNAIPSTNLYRLHLGGTNENMDQFLSAGVDYFHTGLWDATNKVWALRDIQTGVNAISVSNINDTATFAGNIVTASNLYLPLGTVIYSGGYQLIANYGTFCFFAGPSAGNPNILSPYNVGIGYNSMTADTTGAYNTALGTGSLQNSIDGDRNTAIGFSAMVHNADGASNTAVGSTALGGTSFNGGNNIAIGSTAGFSLTTGNGNIDIGNVGVAGEAAIIRIGNGQTDAYLAGALHLTNVVQITGPTTDSTNLVGPRGDTNIVGGTNVWTRDGSGNLLMAGWLTLSNILAGTNRMNFSLGGWTNWAFLAKTNTFSLLDTNGNDAMTVTNVTHSIGLHGNVQIDTNLSVTGTVTGNGSGLTNGIGVPYTTTNLPQLQRLTNAALINGAFVSNGNFSLYTSGGANPSFYIQSYGTSLLVQDTNFNTVLALTNNGGGASVQSNFQAGGIMLASNGFASFGTYSNSLSGFLAWTNTNAFNVLMTYTNGVTNLCFSNSVPTCMFRYTTNSGIYSRHMPPGSVVTNAATSAVIEQE